MRKTTFIIIFITIILLANGEFISSFALEEEYDAKNDIISQYYAQKIAGFKCMQFFGEKELFDIEKYYDETDKISVYVFIYKNLEHNITKQELLSQLESYNSEFQKAKNMIIEGGKEQDYSKVFQGRKLVRKYLKLINQKENFYSIYVSASKTHMPVIEWRKGLPESYTMLTSVKREIREKIRKEPDDIRFYYFGPLELFAEVICDADQSLYLSLSRNLEEVNRSILNRFKFRLSLKNIEQEAEKKLSAAQHKILTKREEKIKKSWDFFEAKTQEELYNQAVRVGIQSSEVLDNVPDFNQLEFENIFPQLGCCFVMALGDVMGYYDQQSHGHYWNLVDFSSFQGIGNHPDGGFFDDNGINAIDNFLLAIANALHYDFDNGGTPAPPGYNDRIENFTNNPGFGNNLHFSVDEDGSSFLDPACVYSTIRNHINNDRPLVIISSHFPNPMHQSVDGPYPERGWHAVVVLGYNTSYSTYNEAICVYTNGQNNCYGEIWWDYADLQNKWTWEITPGNPDDPGILLATPELLAPEEGEILSNPRPTLEWSSISGSNLYRIQIATDPFFDAVYSEYETSNTYFTFPANLPDGTYFWRVVPRNSENNWCHYSYYLPFTIYTSYPTFITNTNSLSVPENGTASFEVKLSDPPISSVNVTVSRISGDSDISVSSGGSFTFTPSNWNDWRTVTLATADDADASSDQATIQISASGIPNKNITAVEEDDDSLNFDTGWDEWPVDEGDTRTCGVRLTAQPASTITATVTKVSGDSDITIQSGSTLTFTTSDWNTWHHITFAAAQDLDAEDGTATVRIRASGVSDKYMPVVERDDDEMEFDIEGGISTLSVNEGGTNTFRVRLTAQPTSTTLVNVYRLSGDSDISVQSGYSLTFTSSNYTQYQTVTIAASEDSDTSNGQATIRMNDNGPIPGKNIIVTEQDNDSLSFLATMNELTIPEGETNNFQVKLSAQPSSDVTVSVTRVSGDSDITVQSGSSLTFTTSSWSQYQMVILAAADDADDTNGQATIRISASGIPNKDIIATEQDDDIVAPEISVKQGTSDISDGGSFNYGSQFVGTNTDITFTIENTGTADLILSGDPIITITGANADQFSVQQQPSSPVNAGNSTTFIVRFSPTSEGTKTASISIANNDSDENPYDITLNGAGIPSSGVLFEEDWNSGVIDSNDWNFVDNIISWHGGHKASVVDGELFINAWDDWTCSCGIISKEGFPYNTRLTLKFRIHRIRVYNLSQSIICFSDSGGIDANGYTTGNELFSLWGGNDNNRTLFIKDNEGTEYSLGNYVPDQDYHLEVIFTSSETKVSANGYTISIPQAYSNYHIHFGGHVEDSYFDDLQICSSVHIKHDFLGTWTGQGVYYRNSDTGAWVKLASPAIQITAGDIDNDGIDDLIGIWPAQGGVWIKYSSIGMWARIASTADWISSGDMNGDGRVDFLGTWSGQGVYYMDAVNMGWVKLATPATQIAAGDIDGDGTDDLLGIWPAQGGIWVKYSSSGSWARLSSTADWIASGDMNGDGRCDLLGTWTDQGVYYKDSDTGSWVKMATSASQIAVGDIDGDGTDDLLGIWPAQGSVWVKYSSSGTWERLSSTADWIAAGRMREAGGGGIEISQDLQAPIGGYAEGPGSILEFADFSSEGPGGWNFVFQEEKNLVPLEKDTQIKLSIPGPGEPWFRCIEQKNLVPQEGIKKKNKKRK